MQSACDSTDEAALAAGVLAVCIDDALLQWVLTALLARCAVLLFLGAAALSCWPPVPDAWRLLCVLLQLPACLPATPREQ